MSIAILCNTFFMDVGTVSFYLSTILERHSLKSR